MATQGKINVTSENIFPVIKKFLYSDHEIFLRELVSNAVDATQKLKTLARAGEFQGSIEDLKVSVKIDADAGTLTVSDEGIGMTAEEIDKYINQIAFSSAGEFLDKYKDKLFPYGNIFFVAGIVTDKILDFLRMQKNIESTIVIVKDFSKIFTSMESFNAFTQKGGKLQVLYPAHLLAVSVNPTSPSGYTIPSDLLCEKMSEALQLPVYDVRKL